MSSDNSIQNKNIAIYSDNHDTKSENSVFSLVVNKINRVISPTKNRSIKIMDDTKRPLILLVDDSIIPIKLISKSLATNGVDCHYVHDGHQAIERIVNEKYDLIVTDVHMPILNGIELVTYIRKSLRLPTPIIAASYDISAKIDILGAGASCFVLKPIHINDFHVTILDLLFPKRY